MIRVSFDPASLQDPAQKLWWDQWLQRAEKATNVAVNEFETWLSGPRMVPFHFAFNNQIWTDLKNWLMEYVFYDKCAYCERLISGYYGDAEHFRPKGAVKYKSPVGTFVEPQCEIIDPASNATLRLGHPGYFWLAYDHRNLVPSCVFCNSGAGKNERFDIENQYFVFVALTPAEYKLIPIPARPRASNKWPGYYYLSPAILDGREGPLLLNPLNAEPERDPRRHLRFGAAGKIAPVKKSRIGETSIEVFQLEFEKLRQARQKAQEEFQSKYYDALRQFDPNNPGQSMARSLLREYEEGRHPFSAAALDFHKILRKTQP